MNKLLILLLGGIQFSVLGHSGGTDSQGGHFNRRTGEYHFHHGMGPHQHPGGVCPYSSGSRINGQSKRDQNFFQRHPLLSIGGGLLVCYWGWAAISDWKKRKGGP